MAYHGIKMELLLSVEHNILSGLDVELQASAVLFHRQLNEAEMRTVGWVILSLNDRTNDEDNFISCALGDWIIKADEWFGKDIGIAWIQELDRLRAYRNHLLTLTGATLIQLQFLETHVKVCCACLGLQLKPADLFSPDPNRAKRTLGQLIPALRGKIAFDQDFGDRLTAFVRRRNQFVHEFWANTLVNSSDVGIPSATTMAEAERFISGLLKEAAELQAPFRGLYYAISKTMAERSNWNQFLSSEVFIELSKYEKDFLSVLGHRDKDKS